MRIDVRRSLLGPIFMNVFAFHGGPVSDQCCIIVGDKRGLIRRIECNGRNSFHGKDPAGQHDHYDLTNLEVIHSRTRCTFRHEVIKASRNLDFDIDFEVTMALSSMLYWLCLVNRYRGPGSSVSAKIKMHFVVPFEEPYNTEDLFEIVQARCILVGPKYRECNPCWYINSAWHFKRIDGQTFELLL